MITTAVRPGSEAALCGFDRCRAPLPGPGPRGGRPFEFCPDRAWPGGKTCKQLAAAQEALRDALGEPADAPALLGAASVVTSAVGQVLSPVQELLAALTAMRAAADAEMTAAAQRVEQAETVAADQRGLREAAEQRAEQATAAAAEATQAAELARAERATAEEDRDAHRRARRQAEQALQHAEGRVAAIQAELTRTIQRADAATAHAADVAAKLAATTADLAASDATAHAERARADAAGKRVTQLAAQVDTLHDRVEAMQARHDQALVDARADTERVRADLEQRITAVRADQVQTIARFRDEVTSLNRDVGVAQAGRMHAEVERTAAVEQARQLAEQVRRHIADNPVPDALRRLLSLTQQPSP